MLALATVIAFSPSVRSEERASTVESRWAFDLNGGVPKLQSGDFRLLADGFLGYTAPSMALARAAGSGQQLVVRALDLAVGPARCVLRATSEA